ncbi:hypothetical protein TELCIR_06639 [Teladorsagia circumcincta]|uniref:Uncharacterized protein n=1 Tax=Teladorsagia circumcincta TaxID=45464 RepID=A0A2G9UML0_TELCI|nr:hypothetical protein TELCIR_06639 [Teladorsagia circumcincta]
METVIWPYCPKWVYFKTGQWPKAQIEAAHQVVPRQQRPFAAVAIAVFRLKPYRRAMEGTRISSILKQFTMSTVGKLWWLKKNSRNK